MAYTKTIIKTEKIEKGEVKISRLLSDHERVFNSQGDVIECFKKAEDLFAVVTPDFCKQLHMHTKHCNSANYMHMIEDARIFCNRVYDSIAAYGIEIQGTTNVECNAVKLITKKDEFLYTLDNNGVPQLLNNDVIEYKVIRRLTLNEEQKMSKKLWSVTDWLFCI